MRNAWWSRLGLAAALGLVMAGGSATAGCASERDPISRVQPDYIKKSDIIGADPKNPTEWYMRMTVIDTARSNQFAFPGLQDELRRIRWDIQEHYLVARRSYELVSGSDGKGADPSKNDGVIVAMFPITSQFDIKRAYNDTTREEQNVIVENTTDRAWFDRDYIRVDWSRNLVTDPDFQNFWIDEIFGDIRWEPVQYYETNPNSENAPVFAFDNGYFDLTQKWFAGTADFYGIRGLPTCLILNYFTGSDVMDCNDQEVAIRTAFMKVGDRDYEPAETDSAKWAMFGTFNRDRFGYSRQYEILDKSWHRLMARQNLWQKSHDDRACMTNGQTKTDADQFCGSVQGSVCDAYSAKCTLPLAKRAVRTIPYFVSRNMPTDLWDENQTLINEWNDALVEAIAVGREVECRRFGGDAASCHGQYFDGDAPKAANGPALVLCHNPSIQGDSPACGGVGTIAREGDLRFNLIGWVDQPLSAAPLGYGPNGADPLTGEVVQSTAYIYGASLDNYATMARDLVAVADGDLTADQFVNGAQVGENLNTFHDTAVTPQQASLYASYADYLQGKVPSSTQLTDAQIAKRISALEPDKFIGRLGGTAAAVDGKSAAARLAAVQSIIAQKGIDGSPGFGGAAESDANLASRAAKLAGTATETNLVSNDQYLEAVALVAAQNKDQASQLEKISSPFGGLGPLQIAGIQQKIWDKLESQGVCMYGMNEFNAPHFEGLARKFALKYKGEDKATRQGHVLADLRKAIYRAVTEHEVGHTMSLRHNFQGSWDSMNFHPNYWKMRTNDGKAAAECTTSHSATDPDTCMGPRYLDPESAEEMGAGAQPHAGIEEFAYSSIMDYGYDFNTDLHGLGSYDKAAMKFVYSGVLETFPAGSKVAPSMAPIHASPLTEQWMVKRTDAKVGGGEQVQPAHYTTVARMLQGEKLLFDPARCGDPKPGWEDDAINGQTCAPAQHDHAHYSEFVSGNLDGIDSNYQAPYWKTKDGRIRWPYRFGTDEYSTYPHTLRFDAGADVYEAADNVSKLYEYRYVLDYFRRGRRGWLPFFSMTSRVWDRYFSRMQSIGWLSSSRVGTYAAMYPTMKPSDNPAVNSDDWGRGYWLAQTNLLGTIERALLRPQPGGYQVKSPLAGQQFDLYEVPDNNSNDGCIAGSKFCLGVTGGRYIDDDLSQAQGGSFHYQAFANRLGTSVEKPVAIVALAAQFPPVKTYVASRETYVDGRNMLLNFRTLMPKAYDQLMAAVMGNDTDAVAPWVDTAAKKDSGGNIPVQYPDLLDPTWKASGSNPVRIDSLVGFHLQVPALIYSFYFGQEDGQQTLQDSLRVWIEGGPEALPLADSEKSFFYEPESGVTWAARNFGTTATSGGVNRPAGVGDRIIQHANYLLVGAYDVQTEADGITPKYDPVTHRPLWVDPAQPAHVKDATALTTLRRYIGVLNVLRQYVWDLRGDLHGF